MTPTGELATHRTSRSRPGADEFPDPYPCCQPIPQAGQPEHALRVFQEIAALVEGNRAYYYEWGVAEGECGHHGENTLLACLFLADQCPARQVDNDQAAKSLSGLGVAFGSLYDDYRNVAFRDARLAVVVLGRTLRLVATTKNYFDKHFLRATEQSATVPEQKEVMPPCKLASPPPPARIRPGCPKSSSCCLTRRPLTFDGLKNWFVTPPTPRNSPRLESAFGLISNDRRPACWPRGRAERPLDLDQHFNPEELTGSNGSIAARQTAQ